MASKPWIGPNEKRCIIRHNLGFYSNVVVGGIYSIPTSMVEESLLQQLVLYTPALTECLRQHHFLSVTIREVASNDPVYVRSDQVDLRNHFRTLPLLSTYPTTYDDGETESLKGVLEQLHNDPKRRFTDVEYKPAWALDVLRLVGPHDKYRLFISFTFSHSHGDGMSGIAFHRTFSEALQRTLSSGTRGTNVTVETPSFLLSEPADTPSRMPISWSYLLRPVLGLFLPGFLARPLGISGPLSGADASTWTGSEKFIETTRTVKVPRHDQFAGVTIWKEVELSGAHIATSVEVVCITAHALRGVLAKCKENGAKLTPLLDLLIARAIGKALEASARDPKDLNFVSQIPMNLRRALDVSDKEVGNYVGGTYWRHKLPNFPTNSIDENSWHAVRLQGQHVVDCASTLRDQPVGLLRYISDFSTWMQDQIGQQRDCSWELSNLGSVDTGAGFSLGDQDGPIISIQDMLFSQPASPIAPPLNFSVIGVKGGGLEICISWQIGALGLSRKEEHEIEEEERKFVRRVAISLREAVERLAGITANSETT